ncbi:MAG: BTAD domain-containing putative transcriptional regulator, partial [Acidobacteriaceae bacterium]
MTRLSINLFGSPLIVLDGIPLKISTQRAIPLLAYLAITEKGQTRETLSNLLWSDTTHSLALASLRTTLWRLKSFGLEEWMRFENNEISLNYQRTIEIDALEFKARLQKCAKHGHPASQICLYCTSPLSEAIDLYHGDFLAGVNLPGAQVFDDWRLQESETFHLLYLEALEKLVRCHRTFGDFNQAIQYGRILVRHDHYNEEAQYDLLQLYSITGQRAAAINQYKRYKELLLRDLAIEPSSEMTSLYKQILVGRTTIPAVQKVKTPVFLIADIENAAELWNQAGVNKDELLSAYHGIFKETSRRFGGHILQRYEDSLTVLFENGHPLHCAATIHLKMKKTDWGSSGPPRVRMVIYSTAGDEYSYNDFAMITQAASQLLSISWGGQVVFTEQTLQFLDQPPGSRIQDLGYHALKDVSERVHVYELLHPHLPRAEHPPLQSISMHSVNLPAFTPGFVGREAELEKLASLLASPDCRMISLVGPGGTGKTRLAVQFASQVKDLFPDGTFFISLASIHDPNLIPIALADSLKFSFYGPRNHNQQISDYLHRFNVLLIFDSFEHLRLEGADFLSLLLDQTHHLKIIVTTRERLNVIPETVMEIGGLPVPPAELLENLEAYSAIKLFIQNAQRLRPRFSLKENAAAVVRICQLVNGLPLGIMLASSWVRVYTCAQIADEIHKSIDFLDISSPEIAPRQRSLRAVFDNSWRLLSPDEQRTLRQLSIFPTSFSGHAAEKICMASNFILSAYIDKSLLQHRSDRFEMLDTFRQYAFGMLNEINTEYDFVRQRFIEYFADFCAQKNLDLNSAIQRQALDEMLPEIENIRSAWAWMIESNRWDLVEKVKDAILTFHIICGNFIQGREFFRSALSMLDKVNDPSMALTRAKMLQFDSWMAIRNGFLAEGMTG